MRFVDSIFAKLLKPVDRRAFKEIVDRHRGDAYDKTFKSWDHLVALVYAQLAGIDGLAGAGGRLQRQLPPSLSFGHGQARPDHLLDANARRPAAIFAENLCRRPAAADRQTRQEGTAMVELIQLEPGAAGRGVQMGDVERPHPRHEAARRL